MRHTELYEELVKEWSPKNGRPLDSYKANSTETGWWICSKGHEWQAPIKGRFSRHGCPYCGGRRPVRGENDAASLYPGLIPEWHPTLNGEHELSDFGPKSDHQAWWVCEKGHVWRAAVKHRTGGRGCPCCKGRLPDRSSSLAAVLPHVAAYWDHDRNGKGPEDYRPHSGKIVWWKCEKGHGWAATIKSMSRIRTTNGCPYCSGKLPVRGETDLATLHPELMLEWDYEKNRKDPSEYTAHSNKRAYWICPKGHSYAATITNRTKGRGCSRCSRGWKPR